MGLSTLYLLDNSSNQLWEDKGAKSISFFCRRRPVLINSMVIEDLKKLSSMNDNRNVRICLHDGPLDKHHNMIILENKGKYYRPHKHLDKGDCFHIIEGELGVFTFDEFGAVIDACTLSDGDIYRVERNAYHAVLPITDQIIYHENGVGPFKGDNDSIFPDWAPDGTNKEEVSNLVSQLYAELNETI